MLKRDIEDARQFCIDSGFRTAGWSEDFLKDVDATGKQMDFHALRHTCGTWLAMRGTPLKTIQAIMRHSSITLTMDTYGHLLPGSEEAAVKSLEAMFESGGGTKTQHIRQYPGRESVPGGATRCHSEGDDRDLSPRQQTLDGQGLTRPKPKKYGVSRK